MQTSTWTVLLKEWMPWLILVFGAEIGIVKYFLVRAKENSLGATKVKEIEQRLDAHDKLTAKCTDIADDLKRVESNQEFIRQMIEKNMEKTIDLLMKGKM